MTFIGYCSNKELITFLDNGEWVIDFVVTSNYDSTQSHSLPMNNNNGITVYLISGMYTLYDDGVEISSDDYTINLTTGDITFSSDPVAGSTVTATYYLSEDYSNSDIEFYISLGAYELEKDTRTIFRELEVTDLSLDVNEGLDYTDISTSKYLAMPYSPILSVSSLVVDGTNVDTTTIKLKGNKIFVTDDSAVDYFTGDYDSIVISFKYGIPEAGHTNEQSRLILLAKEANKYITTVLIAESPLGRNVLLDNSKVTQMSKGDVRPELFNEETLKALRERYTKYINKLKSLSTYII